VALLKKIIFENSIHRTWIQNLLHPLIKEKMIEECNQFEKNKILLLVVPLLFEAKFTDLCTEIWLVKCPREIQKNRLMKRNKISNNDAEKIINLQLNFEDKSKFSDVILDNSDDQKLWINTIQKLL
jgi:dephospho-CoA kinase